MASKAKNGTQSQKFIELAREVETDDDQHAFDEKLKRLAKAKPKKETPDE